VGPTFDSVSEFDISVFSRTSDRSPLWGQDLIVCRNSEFRHFRGQVIGVICPEILEIARPDNNFGESTFRVSAVEKLRTSEGEVMKSEVSKS
jgi:hypothetical protein